MKYFYLIIVSVLLVSCKGDYGSSPPKIIGLCVHSDSIPPGTKSYGIRIKSILPKPSEGNQKIMLKNYFVEPSEFQNFVIEIDDIEYPIEDFTSEVVVSGCSELIIDLPGESYFPREQGIIRFKRAPESRYYFQLAVYKNTSEGVWYSFEEDRKYD